MRRLRTVVVVLGVVALEGLVWYLLRKRNEGHRIPRQKGPEPTCSQCELYDPRDEQEGRCRGVQSPFASWYLRLDRQACVTFQPRST